ncbi:thermonuclease family protein [Pelagibius sp.]|uniref:thermonuclease family protein n=1 Tax=Pelagibius sp. TaxID=1931238 RepID=UPI00260C62E0|nr:thermonuclease family protein [Pelagibius sp.]
MTAPAPRSSVLIALIVLALSVPPAAMAGAADDIRGQARIIDGDSLEVAGQTLDLAGVDAPEIEQRCERRNRLYDCGRLAQAALMDLTAGTEVACRLLAAAPAGTAAPPLARCSAGGYDLSEGMVYTGWALMPPGPQAGGRIAGFETIQDKAAEKQRGLWKGSFVKPWEWRKGARLPLETQ